MTCRYGIFVRNTRTLQHFKRHLRYFCRDVIRRKIESDHSEFRENVVLRSIVQVAKPSTDQEGERERAEDEHQWPPQLQRLRTPPAGDPTEKARERAGRIGCCRFRFASAHPRDVSRNPAGEVILGSCGPKVPAWNSTLNPSPYGNKQEKAPPNLELSGLRLFCVRPGLFLRRHYCNTILNRKSTHK